METNQYKIEKYIAAKKQVDEIKGFYENLISFILVNIVLLVINLITSPEYLWFLWSFFGWGIGIAFHAMKVFNYIPFLGKNWEQRKIAEYMQQENTKKH
ncbi:2TM domain-containing protein [Flavobacterium sp.]|uniref:2TM domain-containing protein n=1 Tax=Flavobacterium sp. TaxID=239 RepID=UPI00374CAF80